VILKTGHESYEDEDAPPQPLEVVDIHGSWWPATPEECDEVADRMMAAWAQFKTKHGTARVSADSGGTQG